MRLETLGILPVECCWCCQGCPEINFRAESRSRLEVGLSYEPELQFKAKKQALLKFKSTGKTKILAPFAGMAVKNNVQAHNNTLVGDHQTLGLKLSCNPATLNLKPETLNLERNL